MELTSYKHLSFTLAFSVFSTFGFCAEKPVTLICEGITDIGMGPTPFTRTYHLRNNTVEDLPCPRWTSKEIICGSNILLLKGMQIPAAAKDGPYRFIILDRELGSVTDRTNTSPIAQRGEVFSGGCKVLPKNRF